MKKLLFGMMLFCSGSLSAAMLLAGSMANNGAINKEIDGISTLSAEIPAGYTSGGTVSLTGDIEAALAAI